MVKKLNIPNLPLHLFWNSLHTYLPHMHPLIAFSFGKQLFDRSSAFFLHEKISRRFFVKGVLFFGHEKKNKQRWPPDLKMKIVKYLCHPGLDSF
jgi:hypothetical protein